jgi:LuxR family maltose regulon positive regulatory protein
MKATTMAPLLETKLFAPRRRRGLVARPRLTKLLDRGLEAKLTLVSAPPGFGKTTLVADWLADRGPAWVALDAAENDPVTFWRYVVAAIARVAPGFGGATEALLDSPAPSPGEVVAALVNDLARTPQDIVLVLDDYHVIVAPAIHEAMAFLLDHLPANIHVVMTTRADPVLPLARLRVRGELVEVRAADLRFTPAEAAAYLNESMGLDLAVGDVATLDARTEGWIAALQLAALSMQGRGDAHGFIESFAGDDRYVVDYLVEEVLGRQPEAVRSFLLETSILERLTAPLVDVVTRREDGRATLEALDRANLFLIPLDDRRRWYRYHHLFADVLRARLVEERPDEVPALHRRASAWFEEHGDRADAIRHSLAGGDVDRAANLIELAIPATRRDRQEGLLRGWLEALPEEVVLARPVLSMGFVGSRMSTGETRGVEPFLRAAERAVEHPNDRPPGVVVVDEAEFQALPGSIAMHRAGLALTNGDVAGTIRHAQRALAVIGDDPYRRGAALALLGLAEWSNGDLDAAYASFAEGMANLGRGGFASDVVGGATTLADLRVAQGRSGDALRLYEDGLALATGSRPVPLRGAADMHVGIAAILRERADLAGAIEHLEAARRLGEANGLPKFAGRFRIAMARVRLAEGDLDAAAALLGDARPRFVTDFSPNVRPIEAQIASLDVTRGRLAAAREWAGARGLSTRDAIDYLGEYEHLVLARLLLAEGDAAGATTLLDRLLAAAEAGGRAGSVLEILVVGALARHALRDEAGALATLDRALALAEPQGAVRAFLDEGAPMTALLARAARRPDPSAHLRRLLGQAPSPADASAATRASLPEPLSERELEVLRLLQGDLDGPELAAHLFVSLNTLRTHTKNVYSKLGVSSRRAAVTRARELGLLP